MSIINYVKKEISFKIVYYGAGVVGKTVNLQYIHRSLPDDNRGNLISLATGDERTLFFDFLPVPSLSVRNFVAKFQLYTVPGQDYYNMTRKLVLRGVDGIVFVADSQWDRLQDERRELQEPRGEPARVRLRPRRAAVRDPVQQARPAQRRTGRVSRVPPQPAPAARAVLRGRRGRRHRACSTR